MTEQRDATLGGTDYHEGPGRIKVFGDTVCQMCPQGHVLQSMPLSDWAKSRLEANPSAIVRCQGA